MDWTAEFLQMPWWWQLMLPLLTVLIVASIVQWLVFIVRFRTIWRQRPVAHLDQVSLILVGKNSEAQYGIWHERLRQCEWAEKMRIIMVDDQSTDRSAQAILDLEKVDMMVHPVIVPLSERFDGTTKLAYTLGIKACRTEFAVIAHLRHHPPHDMEGWVRAMAAPLEQGAVASWSWRQWPEDQGWKRAKHMMKFFQAAKRQLVAKSPTGLVASSFGLRTQAFFEVNGFLSHMHLNGGTIEFLLRDLAQIGPVVPVMQADAQLEGRYHVSQDPRVRRERHGRERISRTMTAWRHAVMLVCAGLLVVLSWSHASSEVMMWFGRGTILAVPVLFLGSWVTWSIFIIRYYHGSMLLWYPLIVVQSLFRNLIPS